jgi:universal stress protein E
MATHIRQILVAIRDARAARSELRKAGILARAAHAKVELFHAIDEPDPERSYPETATFEDVETLRVAIAQKYERRLERLARDPALRGVTVRCTASWDYPPHAAIIRRALATGSDLVIAAARGHRFGARLLLRNTDWELIRHCPAPLLLVKSPRAYSRPLVVAAVDPFHRHARPANLDAQLLQAGGEIARLLRGSLQVFHAYMPLVGVEPMAMPAVPLVAMPSDVEQTRAGQVMRGIAQLAEKHGIPSVRCHISMGGVADQLGAFARRCGAAIVVMGAVSRSALARLFIGNAAERTLDRLSCDVLIVKPRGFKTTVERRPEVGVKRTRAAARLRRKPRGTAVATGSVPPPFL